jgi:uncharacterized protein (TIGR02145 family)
MIIAIGNRIGKNSTSSWQSYWTQQSEVLFFAYDSTDILNKVVGGQLPNQKIGSLDYLTVTGSGLNARYRTPNTPTYKNADTDYCFWKPDASESICDGNRLIAYDFTRIIVKYLDVAPYTITVIMILSSTITPGSTKEDKMYNDFDLSIWWNGTLNSYGVPKGNRTTARNVWPPEVIAITDADGNVYTEVVIGTQTWLVENLKTTKYANGDAITYRTRGVAWKGQTTEAYGWYGDSAASYKAVYGALYNFYAINDARGVCPVGYHIPTQAEINALITYLGGAAVAGGHMKEANVLHWTSVNGDGSSGLACVGGGYRDPTSSGDDALLYGYGIYWTNTASGANAYRYFMPYSDLTITVDAVAKNSGHSIKMIKD